MRRRRAAGKVIEVIKADWHERRDQPLDSGPVGSDDAGSDADRLRQEWLAQAR